MQVCEWCDIGTRPEDSQTSNDTNNLNETQTTFDWIFYLDLHRPILSELIKILLFYSLVPSPESLVLKDMLIKRILIPWFSLNRECPNNI